MRKRVQLSIGAAALLAAGVVPMAGSPAQAADTKADLEVSVAGVKVAQGASEKIGWLKVKNNGPGTPKALTVGVDLSGAADERISTLPIGENCKSDLISAIVCEVPADQIPGPGETLEFPVVTVKRPEGTPSASSSTIGFFLRSPDDTTPDNNLKAVELKFDGEPGVDLGVVVPDVKTKIDIDTLEQAGQALYPGDETAVIGEIFNQGDMVAKGVKITLRAPAGVTFTDEYEGCEYTADRRTANCADPGLVLAPDELLTIAFPIKVATGVKAPSTLPGGSLVADALAEAPVDAGLVKQARKTIFEHARVRAAAAQVADVDNSDNTDDYAVVVAAKGGSGGGGGAGGDEGGLPVTGAKAGLIGGIGAAVLLAGGAMFLIARRRRVVLVTPGDEKPTA
ncbi:hypothetical protein [Micromonospora sp. CB01531]|uniref:hypothetical protein n=1 Tax=Micromonospora sp. CB01531 TaxID=1718947 RepID=UPI000939DD7F|nr:hypothetical protein [Micromonospora sp. CB01531]OKI73848.1 hypothetical protein A6A27_19045 [Micromonospora sp. CB01531]